MEDQLADLVNKNMKVSENEAPKKTPQVSDVIWCSNDVETHFRILDCMMTWL